MSLTRDLDRAQLAAHRTALCGLAIVAFLVVGVGGWAITQQIEDAVIAPGTVIVGSQTKKMQHADGGIVAAIDVAEGDHVTAGDVLIRLDGKLLKSELGTAQRRIFELSAKRWRLVGERDAVTELPPWPGLVGIVEDESQELRDVVVGQEKLFESKRELLTRQQEQLRERERQLQQQIAGQESILASNERQLALTKDEMSKIGTLRDKGLMPNSRWSPLERQEAALVGEVGQVRSQIASARGQIAEIAIKLLEGAQNFRKEALDELAAVEGELSQLVEKHTALKERVGRLEIRAPATGRVHELAVHTVGGVVSPGDVLAFVVPDSEALVVEALVPPREIDRIHTGMPARIRLTSFDRKTTPELQGKVHSVGADRAAMGQNLPAMFKIRIAINDGELKQLGDVTVLPGMETETMLTGDKRTVMSFLSKPLTDQFARVFRER